MCEGQAGSCPLPPPSFSAAGPRPCRGAGSPNQPGTNRQQGGVRHAPAQPHSPNWSRLLRRRRRSAGTGAGPVRQLRHHTVHPDPAPPRHPQTRQAASPQSGITGALRSYVLARHVPRVFASQPLRSSSPATTPVPSAQGTSPAALPRPTGGSCLAAPGTAELAEPGQNHGGFGEAGQQGTRAGASRGLWALRGRWMPPILTHPEVFPHPKWCHWPKGR